MTLRALLPSYAGAVAKIETLMAMPEVDSNRIYTVGYSNGGFMSFNLMCQIGNRLAAGTVAAAGAAYCWLECRSVISSGTTLTYLRLRWRRESLFP